jgi:hypothetical protein
MDVQEENGNNNSFSLETGHRSVLELAEDTTELIIFEVSKTKDVRQTLKQIKVEETNSSIILKYMKRLITNHIIHL